jgi:hypothetical protein
MKETILIPETLKDLRLDQYQKWLKLVNDNEPSDFVNQKTIEIFCDIELPKVAKISYKSIAEILDHINKLFDSKPKFVQRFKIGGKEFGFIPDMENMTFGEFSDLEKYLKTPETFHKAMAVMYRPITNKFRDMYDIEPYDGSDKYSGVLHYATLDVVLGSVVFFYDLLKELSRDTMDYLAEVPMTAEMESTINLIRNMIGTHLFTDWRREMYFDLRLLAN